MRTPLCSALVLLAAPGLAQEIPTEGLYAKRFLSEEES